MGTPKPIDLKAFQWVHEPMPLTAGDYATAKAHLVDRLMGLEGIRAIYEHGTQNYDLGISDVDPVVVTEERLSDASCGVLMALRHEEVITAVLRGMPVMMPETLFKDPLLEPLWVLRRLAGAEQPRGVLEAREQLIASIIEAIDQVGRTTISLSQRATTRRWNVMGTLGNLKGLMHNAKVVFGPLETWPEALQRWGQGVSHLRRHWFTLGPERYRHLVTLTHEGARWAVQSCWKLDALLRQQGWVEPEMTTTPTLATPQRDLLLFMERAAAYADTTQTLQQRCPGWNVVCLPQTFYVQLLAMAAASSGSFRSLLAGCIGGRIPAFESVPVRGLYRELLERRVGLQQAHVEFLQWHGFTHTGHEGAWWWRLHRRRPTGLPLREQWKRRIQTLRSWHRTQHVLATAKTALS